MAARFIPGLRLARDFYAAAVRPLLDEHFPALPHAAALLGPGSEVAGFDGERSTDHDWAPRLQVFLADRDVARSAAAVDAMLATPRSGWRSSPRARSSTTRPGS